MKYVLGNYNLKHAERLKLNLKREKKLSCRAITAYVVRKLKLFEQRQVISSKLCNKHCRWTALEFIERAEGIRNNALASVNTEVSCRRKEG